MADDDDTTSAELETEKLEAAAALRSRTVMIVTLLSTGRWAIFNGESELVAMVSDMAELSRLLLGWAVEHIRPV